MVGRVRHGILPLHRGVVGRRGGVFCRFSIFSDSISSSSSRLDFPMSKLLLLREGGREYQRRNGRCIVPFFLPRKDQWTGQALNFSFHPLLSLPPSRRRTAKDACAAAHDFPENKGRRKMFLSSPYARNWAIVQPRRIPKFAHLSETLPFPSPLFYGRLVAIPCEFSSKLISVGEEEETHIKPYPLIMSNDLCGKSGCCWERKKRSSGRMILSHGKEKEGDLPRLRKEKNP